MIKTGTDVCVESHLVGNPAFGRGRLEALSLDEAFLDLTGTQRLLGSPAEVGERLRQRVRAETQLPVSVGIGPVKLVAKIASAAAKPDGLLEVAPEDVREFLAPLPVRRLWGVGPVAERRLVERGFRRVGDLASADPSQIEGLLGASGLHLAQLARGEDLRDVESETRAVSYSEENTFRHDVSDREVLEATLVAHAEAVARRLRRDALVARTVVVKLKLARRRKAGPRGYPLLTRRETLPEATDDGAVLSRTGSRLLDRAALREPVRLLGVGATNLRLRSAGQLDLFAESAVNSPRRSLNRALDEIRDRFGDRAIARGAVAEPERAGLSQQHKRGV